MEALRRYAVGFGGLPPGIGGAGQGGGGKIRFPVKGHLKGMTHKGYSPVLYFPLLYHGRGCGVDGLRKSFVAKL